MIFLQNFSNLNMFKSCLNVIIKTSFKVSFLNVPFWPNFPLPSKNQQVKPPTVIGQFHTLFFGSVRMFFLGVLGFAVYGNEALHFSCDPDKREINLFCYNQFRPITPQVSFRCVCKHWLPNTSSFFFFSPIILRTVFLFNWLNIAEIITWVPQKFLSNPVFYYLLVYLA